MSKHLRKKRYSCRNNECPRSTFISDYSYQAYQVGVKRKIIDMTLNGSGVRDIARVLKISPTTVIEELKKRIRARVGQYMCA